MHSSLIIISFSQVNFHLLPRISETKPSQYELCSSESYIKYSNTDSYGLNDAHILNTPISLFKIIIFSCKIWLCNITNYWTSCSKISLLVLAGGKSNDQVLVPLIKKLPLLLIIKITFRSRNFWPLKKVLACNHNLLNDP